MRPAILLVRSPSLQSDNFEVRDFPYLRDPDLQRDVRDVYGAFTPARNATNANARGIRFGVLVKGEFTWFDRDTYSLPVAFNKEEAGRIRQMDLIPEDFLRKSPIERHFHEMFAAWNFEEDSFKRAYEIQLSAIRYAPLHGRTAIPGPAYPHQDLVDTSVTVLGKENITGGVSRIFTLDDQPLYEFDLIEGQGYLVKDAAYKHYVSDVQLPIGVGNGFRDILAVRFQPLGR